MAAPCFIDLKRQFKRYRYGRPGWFLREARDRLRLLSTDDLPGGADPLNWSPETLNKAAQRMRQKLVGERMGPGTWDRTWAPYLKRLEEVAGE